MKEHIEEMTKVLIDYTKKNHIMASHVILEDYAEALYNAGYRKQREGVWRGEMRERCDWRGKKQQYFQPNSCSLCHEPVAERTPYCPNCGAKMKGGAE